MVAVLPIATLRYRLPISCPPCAPPNVGLSEDSSPGWARAGGNCAFPSSSLARLGRASPKFSRDVRRSGCPFRPAAPVRNPAAAHYCFLDARCPSMVGDTNSALSMPFIPGCPLLRNQLSLPTHHGDPAPVLAARCRACTCSPCRHALGRRRGFAPPCRSRSRAAVLP